MSHDQTPVPRTRIAMAGFGAWGQMHARALAAIEGAEIVAVLARSSAAREAAGAQLPNARLCTDLSELLAIPKVDAVSVTVPNHLHAETAVAALQSGHHVFLEKPLGLSLKQCDTVIDAARTSNRQVVVNHELRVSHQWAGVRRLIAAGELGSIRHQHFSLFRKPFRTGSDGWRYDPARVGSWVLEELVHFVDLVTWYAAESGPPTRVSAFGDLPDKSLSNHLTVVLHWPDGATATLNQSLAGFEHHTVLDVAGTQGALRTWWSGAMDRALTPSFEMKRSHADGRVEAVAIPISGEVFELEAMWREACIGFAQQRSIMSAEQARLSVAICLAAEQAWRSGQTQTIA
jgi:myo-inositol 2-dehydrogenase/D-chiro-inositol 1-dehydrogenase